MNDYTPRYFFIERSDDVCVARFRESNLMGTALADSASRDLQSIISSTPDKALIIDFTNVRMISSSMIATLIKSREMSLSAGIWFRMCGMSSSLRHIFQTLRLDGAVFEIHDTVDEAIASANAGPTYFERFGKHPDR